MRRRPRDCSIGAHATRGRVPRMALARAKQGKAYLYLSSTGVAVAADSPSDPAAGVRVSDSCMRRALSSGAGWVGSRCDGHVAGRDTATRQLRAGAGKGEALTVVGQDG